MMARSSRWINRRREERQQQAAERAQRPLNLDLPCTCRSTLPTAVHNERAHLAGDRS